MPGLTVTLQFAPQAHRGNDVSRCSELYGQYTGQSNCAVDVDDCDARRLHGVALRVTAEGEMPN